MKCIHIRIQLISISSSFSIFHNHTVTRVKIDFPNVFSIYNFLFFVLFFSIYFFLSFFQKFPRGFSSSSAPPSNDGKIIIENNNVNYNNNNYNNNSIKSNNNTNNSNRENNIKKPENMNTKEKKISDWVEDDFDLEVEEENKNLNNAQKNILKSSSTPSAFDSNLSTSMSTSTSTSNTTKSLKYMKNENYETSNSDKVSSKSSFPVSETVSPMKSTSLKIPSVS